MSADWPGAFEHSFDASHPGTAIYLVADNGSEEDPQTNPPVIPNGSENHTNTATQFIQAQATGEQFARLTADAAQAGQQLRPGPVILTRKQICVPLENNGFVALAAAGEFGKRQGYVCDTNGNPVTAVPNGSTVPTASTQFRTFIAYANVGPDLQLIDIPGEAFPSLILGSPFGVEDESCNRPNPEVPMWHAKSIYRFSVGLADDLLGYLIPAWGFASGTPGLFNNDSCYQDMNGHRHKLESESVGPSGANDVANGLSTMLSSSPDPTAQITQGRYVEPNGSLSRWPTGAVGALIQPGNILVGDPTTAGFGNRAVDKTGLFMDYDGQPQASPDITTRGIMVFGSDGCVAARYYLNVFPDLTAPPTLAHVTTQPAQLPTQACPLPGDPADRRRPGGAAADADPSAAGRQRRSVRCLAAAPRVQAVDERAADHLLAPPPPRARRAGRLRTKAGQDRSNHDRSAGQPQAASTASTGPLQAAARPSPVRDPRVRHRRTRGFPSFLGRVYTHRPTRPGSVRSRPD